MRTILYVVIGLAMCCQALGQLYVNRDDVGTGTPGWQAPCYYPSCNPGGVGTPTLVNQTFVNASPSIDGNSMKMTQTGTNYSNSMFHYSFGANNSATTFTGTYTVYIQSSLSPWQVFGMDMYDFIPGVRLMFGSQCTLNGSTNINSRPGYWSFFNQGTGPNGTWYASTIPCPIAAPNTWYTISMTVHRVPGDTSCSGGVPAEHYDSITQNGVTYTINLSYCSETYGGSNDTGMQFDVSGSSAGGTNTAFVDEMSYLPSVGPVTTNYDNIYCPFGTPTWGASDGPATLPVQCFNTALANTPANGSVINVAANNATDLQNKLNAAACGQQITLPAGSVYSGHFTYPALNCPTNNYVWLVTSGLSSLPAEAARYSPSYINSQGTQSLTAPQFGPCYAGVSSLPGRPTLNCPSPSGTFTAQIISPDSSPAFNFSAGTTSSFRMIGIEVTRATGTGFNAQLINVGNVGTISNIIFDRIWCHGDELQDETESCFNTSAVNYLAAVDSYFNDFYCISVSGHCTDSHPIYGGLNQLNSTSETGHKFVNNFMEGSGENILYGGGAANATPGDIEYRGNLNFKPMTWRAADPAYDGGIGGNPYIVKNLFELKNAQRVFVEGNYFINNWSGFSQGGECWAITPVNQSGNAPTAFDANITLRYNWCTSINFGIELDITNNGGYLAAADNHYSLHDDVFENMGYCEPTACSTSNPTVQMTTSRQITLLAQAQNNATVNHLSFIYSPVATPSAALGLSNPTIASGLNQYSEIYTNNLQQTFGGTLNVEGGSDPTNCANSSGIGAPMFAACWTTYTVGGNCFINNGSHTWPGTNATSVASYAAALTSYNNGFGGNYVVAAGACKAAGTDGLDPGANIPLVSSYFLIGSQSLTVTVSGNGSVVDNLSEISCPSTCMAGYTTGTVVTLSAAPSGGYLFTGWSGPCSGSGTCVVTMSSGQSVTALFTAIPSPTGLTFTNGIQVTDGIGINP